MRTATVVILVLLTSLAHAEEQKTVVLLPLQGPTGAEGETVAEAARDLLAAVISRPGGPRLVTREELARVLAEQQLVARSSPDAAQFARTLLRSRVGAERRTALSILESVDPDQAAQTGWNFLEDEDYDVRRAAFWMVELHHPDPAEGFLRILEWWDRLIKPIENPNFRQLRNAPVQQALRGLSQRALELEHRQGSPKLPQVKDGPDAFKRWFAIWTTRVREYREILPKWTAAEGEERDRLFVELAATGDPSFLRLVARRKLGPVNLEALTAFARATGFEQKPAPEPGAKPDEIGRYRYLITEWIFGGYCRW